MKIKTPTPPTTKCYCSACPNSSCYTDGVCFSQLSLDSSRNRHIVHRCLNKSQMIISDSLYCQEKIHYYSSNIFDELTDEPMSPDSDDLTRETVIQHSGTAGNHELDNNDFSHMFDNSNHTNASLSRNTAAGSRLNSTTDLVTHKHRIQSPAFSGHQVTKCCYGLDYCNQRLTLDFPETTGSVNFAGPMAVIVYAIMALGVFVFVTLALKKPRLKNLNTSPQTPPQPQPRPVRRTPEANDNHSTTSREPLIKGANPKASGSKLPTKRPRKFFSSNTNHDGSSQSSTIPAQKSSVGTTFEPSSGSGSGSPLLTERSIAREITVLESIGRGRSADVRKGLWRGEFVAVKIFTSVDEASWVREVQIYQQPTMRHENILRFIAADNRDNSIYTELWLVTDYHPLGSIFGFLSNGTIDLFGLVKLTYSIADALSYLHGEIKGTSAKPAIAHRDLKSRNILVKVDGTCALADFGLAVSYQGDFLHVPANLKEGTKRYMPPEVLLGEIDMNTFDSFTRADMYSLGLVLWEICRRTRAVSFTTPSTMMPPPPPQNPHQLQVHCPAEPDMALDSNGAQPIPDTVPLSSETMTQSANRQSPNFDVPINGPNNGPFMPKMGSLNFVPPTYCESYELPYTEQLGADPSFEKVRELVAENGFRPRIPERWMTNELLKEYVNIMKECWYHNPKSRLTALRVKKSIINLRSKLVR